MTEIEQESENQPARKWQSLDRTQRRVAGVLVEKAKTTPDNYPLSTNAIVNGGNQKSNRFPQMQLDESDVYDALESLRLLGAIAQIQGDGRVEKYRHLLYDWLGVDKVELAVMGELLLRGAQTLGELRGRAARMEPIAGISELRPVVASLVEKELVLYLTPPGRGCVVTHNLYQPQELEKVRKDVGSTQPFEAPAKLERTENRTPPASNNTVDELREEVSSLRSEVAELRALVEELM